MKDNKYSPINLGVNKNDTIILRSKDDGGLLIYCYYAVIVIMCVLIVGCVSTKQPAPVVDRTLNDSHRLGEKLGRKGSFYVVQRGDTLYSIAANHGVTLSELAEWNGIDNPNAIEPGQQIRISLSAPVTTQATQTQPTVFPLGELAAPTIAPILPMDEPSEAVVINDQIKREPKGLKLPYSDRALAEMQNVTNAPTAIAAIQPSLPTNRSARIEAAPVPKLATSANSQLSNASIQWMWPASGALIEGFSKESKGVRIAGESGHPVLASAAGEVVYSGSGLRGYGKLVIIKHNDTFLSAYAYNSKLLVKEGDTVAKGQKIAEMGNTDTDTVKLHFEIREQGKPVDPLKYLPGRPG